MTYGELIKEKNYYTSKLTDYVCELRERSNKDKLKEFSEMRQFSMETIEDAGIFYVGDPVEMLLPRYIDMVDSFGVISPTNKRPIFHDRFVIPIKDVDGNIMNLVGYSKEANERYVYGTSVYYRRREDMWGLERLNEAYDLGYAILTEGITDTIALRNLGYRPVFANCGTHSSTLAMKQLNRCRYGVLEIPDRDPAGQRAKEKWKVNRYIRLNTFIEYKDVDEMIKKADNGSQWVSSYIDNCIDWLRQKEHKGFECEKQEVTMY